jgi:2-dehydro-3-deoxyphosphogluconate aldolase / (4S)-4-hydroxy-2-oxoglutarate aldolase
MDAQTVFDRIEHSGIMAGMRGGFPPEVALKISDTLIEAGQIDVFEFTMNSDRPLEAMQAVKRALGDTACVGMGTVLDADTARSVVEAGADFVIAPSFSPAVVEVAQKAGVLAVPGVITPTEIVDAWATGVKLLKIFPIGALGLEYFKAVRAPLNHVNFICNGGMNAENAAEFLKAGAVACGMAGWLTGDGSMPLNTIEQRGRLLREIVTRVRSGQPVRQTV